MAQIIAGSIVDRGDAVLIVTSHAGVILVGFVTRSSLSDLHGSPQPMPECITFVQNNMHVLKPLLLEKSGQRTFSDNPMGCIEITLDDIRSQGLDRLSGFR